MFIQALKAAGKNPTTTSIQKAAAKMTYQIKDVIGPTTYPAAYTLGTSCAQLAKSDGAAFSVVVPYGCYPAYVFGTGDQAEEDDPRPDGLTAEEDPPRRRSRMPVRLPAPSARR